MVYLFVQRTEVVQWIVQGAGEVVSSQTEKDVQFIVERHGAVARVINGTRTTAVSSHWIRSCLEVNIIVHKSSYSELFIGD